MEIKILDRRNNKTRKWDKDLIKNNFNMENNVIPMDIADLDFDTPIEIKNALLNIINSGDYSYTYVYEDYYNAIISWNKRKYNVDIEKDNIKLTFGTCSTINYLLQCFCKENDKVLVNIPAYAPFISAIKNANLIPVLNKLILKDNKYFIDFDKLEDDFKKNNIKIYILCSPQNPSGRIWNKEELTKIAKLCLKYNVLLISDEVHRDILRTNEKFISMNNIKEIDDLLITCVSPNKSFNLGGLKGSYVIIKNKKIMNKFLKYLEKVYVTSPNILIQPALITAYTKCDYWLSNISKYIENNFNFVYDFIDNNLPKISYMKAQSSFLIWLNFKNIFQNEDEIAKLFNEINITYVLGSYFGLEKSECFVRINLGTSLENVKEFLTRLYYKLNEITKNDF